MKVTETRSHDKDDNYKKGKTESGKEMGRMRQGWEKSVLFSERLYWVNQVQKKEPACLLSLLGYSVSSHLPSLAVSRIVSLTSIPSPVG
jgi:hypothetical protein